MAGTCFKLPMRPRAVLSKWSWLHPWTWPLSTADSLDHPLCVFSYSCEVVVIVLQLVPCLFLPLIMFIFRMCIYGNTRRNPLETTAENRTRKSCSLLSRLKETDPLFGRAVINSFSPCEQQRALLSNFQRA